MPDELRGYRCALAMAHFSSLGEIESSLREQLPINAVFTSVNTRLIIQTGINLKQIREEQNRNPVVIGKVTEALRRMGLLEGAR